MRKILLTLLCFFFGLTASMAQKFSVDDFSTKVYTEPLVVTVNGIRSDPQDADISVTDNKNNTINFELKNFCLKLGGVEAGVGNIALNNLAVTEGEDGLKHASYEGTVRISEGDKEGVNYWIGPLLEDIPLKFDSKMNDEKLYATIDITMMVGGENKTIHVTVGTDDFNSTFFTEQYVVTVNKENPTDPADITIGIADKGDNTIDFILRDFTLSVGAQDFSLGDFTLEDVAIEEGEDGLIHFSKEGTFDLPTDGLPQQYAMLVSAGVFNKIPYTLKGKYSKADDPQKRLFATIDIDLQQFGQKIHVEVGKLGDVNCDGSIDIADAVSVLNAMAGESVSGNADVNNDATPDIADFVTVLNIMAGE